MREDLKDKEVLAMYDVRGIQNYIFRTNKIREIVGASEIVENIIIEGFEDIIDTFQLSREWYLTAWEKDDPTAYLTDIRIKMQVLFIGGGNAYVLFREGRECETFNKRLAKYVLEHTYSLQLAVAVVEKTSDYSIDYAEINNRMREIKATMPSTKPMGAFPFMAVDSLTGFPLVQESLYRDGYVCTESLLKQQKCVNIGNVPEKLLDNMATQKGNNSFLAVVHIDGNNMGKRIKKIMERRTEYADAIQTMRQISAHLKTSFIDSYKVMGEYIDKRTQEIKPGYHGKLYRKLILAGDDITFICNAMVALDAVKVFLQDVCGKVMYVDDSLSEEENLRSYGLSACGGIAFMHSHFPFGDAYEVAEACCSVAKKRAKEAAHRAGGLEDGAIGCYMDFQICNHVKTTDLEKHRTKNYQFADEDCHMIYRPYYVSCEVYDRINDLNERNKEFDFEKVFLHNLKRFSAIENSRSKMKSLRNAFSFGMGEVKKEIIFLQSRKVNLPTENEPYTWYDALELMDLCKLEGDAK